MDLYMIRVAVAADGIVNDIGAGTAGQLAAIAKNRLESIQHRPQLIDAFGTQTGLTLERP